MANGRFPVLDRSLGIESDVVSQSSIAQTTPTVRYSLTSPVEAHTSVANWPSLYRGFETDEVAASGFEAHSQRQLGYTSEVSVSSGSAAEVARLLGVASTIGVAAAATTQADRVLGYGSEIQVQTDASSHVKPIRGLSSIVALASTLAGSIGRNQSVQSIISQSAELDLLLQVDCKFTSNASSSALLAAHLAQQRGLVLLLDANSSASAETSVIYPFNSTIAAQTALGVLVGRITNLGSELAALLIISVLTGSGTKDLFASSAASGSMAADLTQLAALASEIGSATDVTSQAGARLGLISPIESQSAMTTSSSVIGQLLAATESHSHLASAQSVARSIESEINQSFVLEAWVRKLIAMSSEIGSLATYDATIARQANLFSELASASNAAAHPQVIATLAALVDEQMIAQANTGVIFPFSLDLTIASNIQALIQSGHPLERGRIVAEALAYNLINMERWRFKKTPITDRFSVVMRDERRKVNG